MISTRSASSNALRYQVGIDPDPILHALLNLLVCATRRQRRKPAAGHPLSQYAHPPQKIKFLIQIYDEEALTVSSRRRPQDRRRKPESDSTTHDVTGGKQTTKLIYKLSKHVA